MRKSCILKLNKSLFVQYAYAFLNTRHKSLLIFLIICFSYKPSLNSTRKNYGHRKRTQEVFINPIFIPILGKYLPGASVISTRDHINQQNCWCSDV